MTFYSPASARGPQRDRNPVRRYTGSHHRNNGSFNRNDHNHINSNNFNTNTYHSFHHHHPSSNNNNNYFYNRNRSHRHHHQVRHKPHYSRFSRCGMRLYRQQQHLQSNERRLSCEAPSFKNNACYQSHKHDAATQNQASQQRTYHSQRRKPKHTLVSSKRGTLLSTRNNNSEAYFYDTETDLARRVEQLTAACHSDNVIWDAQGRQEMLHQQTCLAIQDAESKKQRELCTDLNGNPCTPSASEDEHDDEQDDHVTGAMKSSGVRFVWETTVNNILMDENGVDLMETEISEKDRPDTAYGMYTVRGARRQALQVPPDPCIDGAFLIDHAKIVTCKKSKQMKKVCRDAEVNRLRDRKLSRMERDNLEAQKLASYLDYIRSSTAAMSVP